MKKKKWTKKQIEDLEMKLGAMLMTSFGPKEGFEMYKDLVKKRLSSTNH